MDDPTAEDPAPDVLAASGVAGAPPSAADVLGPAPYLPGYGVPPSRQLRAPGAEHPLPPIARLGINPNRLQHLAPEEVAKVVDAVAARSLGNLIGRHRPEHGGYGGMPDSNERLR